LRIAAFDFQRHEGLALLQDEIDFLVALAPIGDGDVGAQGGIEQMRACRGRHDEAITWRARVVLPTWRGPANTCKKRRFSWRRLSGSSWMVWRIIQFTQYAEYFDSTRWGSKRIA